jgi:hypothetical protein
MYNSCILAVTGYTLLLTHRYSGYLVTPGARRHAEDTSRTVEVINERSEVQWLVSGKANLTSYINERSEVQHRGEPADTKLSNAQWFGETGMMAVPISSEMNGEEITIDYGRL